MKKKQSQEYDKIFKENLEALMPSLLARVLHIQVENMEEIPDDLQRTIERRPDYLKKMRHEDAAKDYILHIEFQTADERKMVFRMLEYKAMALRNYEMDVQQYVFFIGEGRAEMSTSLSKHCLEYSFGLINMQDISYRIFLDSDKPEDVVLAILADFEGVPPPKIIHEILEQLISIDMETLDRQKAVVQLEILSNLRNLQTEIAYQITEYMALNYDIRKDLRYKQGLEQGLEKGLEQGLEKGLEKGLEQGLEKGVEQGVKIMVKALLKQGKLTHAEIAEVAKVSIEYVQQLANDILSEGNKE